MVSCHGWDSTFKEEYNARYIRRGDLSWMSRIWSSHITPWQLILVYLMLRNKLATNDNLRKYGLVITSYCCMCMNDLESVQHLFLECSFTQWIWQWLGNQFHVYLDCQSDDCSFFKYCFALHMSFQVRDLWLAAIIPVCWGVWFQ